MRSSPLSDPLLVLSRSLSRPSRLRARSSPTGSRYSSHSAARTAGQARAWLAFGLAESCRRARRENEEDVDLAEARQATPKGRGKGRRNVAISLVLSPSSAEPLVEATRARSFRPRVLEESGGTRRRGFISQAFVERPLPWTTPGPFSQGRLTGAPLRGAGERAGIRWCGWRGRGRRGAARAAVRVQVRQEELVEGRERGEREGDAPRSATERAREERAVSEREAPPTMTRRRSGNLSRTASRGRRAPGARTRGGRRGRRQQVALQRGRRTRSLDLGHGGDVRRLRAVAIPESATSTRKRESV